MKKISLYLFFLISLINIFGNFLEIELLTTISKPLLMPLLAFFFITSWTSEKNKIYLLTLVALFLSWAGDVLLMFQVNNPSFFIFGLGAFLLAHIAYCINNYHLHIDLGLTQNKTFVISRIAIVSIVGGALLNILWPNLGDLKIPVSLYTAVIVLMAVMSILRKDRTSPSSFSFIYAGALFFIISDGMIAISKFVQPFENSHMFIMLTYIIAQFFIVKGILAHNNLVYNCD